MLRRLRWGSYGLLCAMLAACVDQGASDPPIAPEPERPDATVSTSLPAPDASVAAALPDAAASPEAESAPRDAARVTDGRPSPDGRPAVVALPTVTVDLPFRSRFGEGDLAGWTPLAGTWGLCTHDAQSAYCQSDTVQAATFAGNPAWTNYDVKAVVVIVDDLIPGTVQIAFRVQSTDRYWAFHVGRPYANGIAEWELTVHNKSSYGHTNGGGFSYTKGVPFTIHFKVNGPTVAFDSLDKGKTHTFNITHNDLPLSGRIGLGSKGQAVKFLSVEVVPL